MASLQHEAEERTAAIAAMQAELQSIRNQLAAARQVSRSLLAALRAGPVVTPVVDEPVRHRRGIFHLIRLWARHARL